MFVVVHKRWLAGLAMLMLSGSLAGAQETPAEKIRKTLEQPINLNFSGQDLDDVLNHLRDKTGITFAVDQNAQMVMPGFGPVPPGIGGPPAGLAVVDIKSDGGKLKVALQKFVQGHGLTYVVLENSVLITTEESAVTRQLGQRVSVNISDVPLQKALKDLMRRTPLNLVIDPRVVKDAQNPVSLDLEGITVETAVRLLAEIGGLKSVRVDNVLFVTSEARAEKMRLEQPPAAAPPANRGWPFGNGPGMGAFGIGIAAPPRVIQAAPVVPAAPPVKALPPQNN